jgi:hypothetical protein
MDRHLLVNFQVFVLERDLGAPAAIGVDTFDTHVAPIVTGAKPSSTSMILPSMNLRPFPTSTIAAIGSVRDARADPTARP